MRETLKVAAKSGSRKAKEELINPEEFPPLFYDVWQWFTRLQQTRPQGLNALGPISEQEMQAFFSNRGIRPAAWQVETLAMLDLQSRGLLVVEEETK